MTQYNFPTIDPAVNTGTQLSQFLNAWAPALETTHAGTARPTYATPGMLWLRQVSSADWRVTLYDGTRDTTIFSIDTTTGAVLTGGGNVVGPASVLANSFAQYNGATGKLIKQGPSAIASDTDATTGAVVVQGSGGFFGWGGARGSTALELDNVSFDRTGVYTTGASEPNFTPPPGQSLSGTVLNYCRAVSATAGQAIQQFYTLSNVAPRCWLRSGHTSTYSTWAEYLTTYNADNMAIATSLASNVDNQRTLGSAARRWSVVYAGTGTINTSDAREKTEVTPLTADEIAAAQRIAREFGTFQFLYAVEEKGATGARLHVGTTVQRVMEIMTEHGLDPLRYGAICHDEWDEVWEHTPAEYEYALEEDGTHTQGAMITPAADVMTAPAGDRYGFRADELMAFVMRGVAARQDELEARLLALESA